MKSHQTSPKFKRPQEFGSHVCIICTTKKKEKFSRFAISFWPYKLLCFISLIIVLSWDHSFFRGFSYLYRHSNVIIDLSSLPIADFNICALWKRGSQEVSLEVPTYSALIASAPPDSPLLTSNYTSPTDKTMPSDEKKESWTSIYTTPPSVQYPYDPKEAIGDIPGVSYALDLFLASHMLESEDYCNQRDEKKWVSLVSLLLSYAHSRNNFRERLYFATGYGLIQCVKGLMSYEDDVRTYLSPPLHQSNFFLPFFRISSQELPTQNTETS